MLTINQKIQIPESELEEQFVRSSGPGGQNVNKVATAVQLRFDVENSRHLDEEVKSRLKRAAASYMMDDGVILIKAKRYRTQERNREDARARLAALIRKALHKPKRRKKTKPSRAARQRRLDEKKQQSDKKKHRRKPRLENN